MTWPQASQHAGPRRAFLVERYLSPTAAVDLGSLTAGVARLCAASDTSATPVRYLYSVYLPTEDTCFCLFWAPSADAVRAINNERGFALDRVIDAVLLQGDHHDHI